MAVSYSYSKDLNDLCRQMIKKFPDSFGHIDPEQLLTVSSDRRNPTKVAEVRRVQAQLKSIMPYRVIMVSYDEIFDDLPDNVKKLVVVHELEHIAENPFDDDDYTLRQHEVQDWIAMVQYLGPNWYKNSKFDITKSKEKNWRDALQSPGKKIIKKRRRSKR